VLRLEERMAQLKGIVRGLQVQRAAARATIDRLDRAIEALAELGRRVPGRQGGPRRMSAGARRRIADAQRARWARIRAQKTGKSKRTLPTPPAPVGA
jgi:ABC-type microcin C transport system duplicated ATPase subunit YejF